MEATEIRKKIEDLEKRVQNLITSHQQLRAENAQLKNEKLEFEKMLEEERNKVKRIEEGYRQLKQSEKIVLNKNIISLKTKIGHLVSEIDKNIALINEKKK